MHFKLSARVWLMALASLYGLAILSLSTQPLRHGWLAENYRQLCVDYPHFDKLVHLIAYGVFGVILRSLLLRWPMPVVLVVGLLFGVADEFVQSTTLGRESSVEDLMADMVGLSVGIVLTSLVARRMRVQTHSEE